MKKIFLSLLPFIFVFLASIYTPTDPDLGWHLKYGEYFFQNGKILRDNIFSTEMPNYTWVNSSYATDILTYFTFHNFGFFGLSILGALTITLILFTFSKSTKLNLWAQVLIFPFILYMMVPLFSVSFRGQLLSLLFLGIQSWILSRYDNKLNKKTLLILPLYTLWSNFHGGFLLGLGILIIWVVTYVIKEVIFNPKSKWKDILITQTINFGTILLGVFAFSLINPYFLGIYHEAFSHFGNPWQKYITEWLPFDDMSFLWWNHLLFGFVMFYSSIFLFFSNQFKKQLPNMVVFLLVFTFSLLMRRYAWTAYLLALPVLAPAIEVIKPNNKTIQTISIITLVILMFYATFDSKQPFNQYKMMDWEVYCQKSLNCSRQATQFLIDNKLTENLMTTYDWGGYMIWNFPQIKPSIDGRMHLWRDEAGYSAFAYYYPFEQNWKDIDQSKYNIVFMSTKKEAYNRLIELVKEKKWRIVYQDNNAAIFIRNQL